MPHKIAAYLRVSTEEQAAALEGSLDNQKYRLKAFVDGKVMQEKSWGKIVDFYIDDGFSAKDTNRPAYQRMLMDLKSKKIDLILVTDLSRLSRNLLDFCALLNFMEKHKAGFLSIKEQFDTSTSIGRMMVYQVITLAQFEREQTSERVSLGVHARAMRGLMNGGKAILGFDKDPKNPGIYISNRREAKLVQKIFDVYLEEGTLTRSIHKLEELGIGPNKLETSELDTKRGWTCDNLSYLLSNHSYRGHYEVNKKNKDESQDSLKPHQKYQIVKAPWPALVDDEVFYRVQSQLEFCRAKERTRLQNAKSRVYVLSGIFKCAECGHTLVGQTFHGHGGAYRYYGHTHKGSKQGCKVQRISADEIESVVIKHLKASLMDSSYFKSLKAKLRSINQGSETNFREELKSIESEIQNLEKEATNIFRMQSQANFGTDVLKMMSERLEAIARKKNQLVESSKMLVTQQNEVSQVDETVSFVADSIGEFSHKFDKAPVGLKKRLIRNTIKQVALAPDKLALWFYANPEDRDKNSRHLQLVSDETSEAGVSLVSRENQPSSNQSAQGLFIVGIGDPGTTRTCDLLLRRQLLYPAELPDHLSPLTVI